MHPAWKSAKRGVTFGDRPLLLPFIETHSRELTDLVLTGLTLHHQFRLPGLPASHVSSERLRGFRSRLRQHGFRRVALATGDFHYQGGFKAALALCSRDGYPDAVFCANDLMAMGAIDALRRSLSLRVPE